MKYLMLVCVDESVELSPAERAAIPEATEAWVSEMDAKGIRLLGNQLAPSSDATTVRVRGTDVLLGDGPFAETKEQIAGFDLIECADLDQAIEVASKHPVARFGALQIRPYM
jgi:hypothetical protein